MKKIFSFALIAVFLLSLAACGQGQAKESANGHEKLVVGASPVPHAEVLEAAKPILAKMGIDLQIVKFQDYVLPNVALKNKEIDANYFQTPGYLDLEKKQKGYDFVSVGAIHKEPIGVYSKKYKSLKDLPDHAKIIISNSLSDEGRILPIFEKAGLIKLKAGSWPNARLKDIISNPKHLDFSTQIEAKLLPEAFNNNEGDVVVINTNYALEGKIDIEKYGIAFEGKDVVPPNLVVVRKGDESRKAIKELVKVLKSPQIKKFIEDKYHGAVIPAE